MKTFNQWMNEEVTNPHGTQQRYKAFKPELNLHPIQIAEHTWDECSKEYTLHLDSFLTQLRIMMKDDPRVSSYINKFKEEMVKTMVDNAAGFFPGDLKKEEQTEPEKPKLNLV